MEIGIVGAGINGLRFAWQLAREGHQVQVYERDAIMLATSPASSKVLHGDLRYLDGDFRLVLSTPCPQSHLLEIPGQRRIFFVLPWKGQTLVGTTEARLMLAELIECSIAEQDYLLDAYRHNFPTSQPEVVEIVAGLRSLLRSAQDPNKATREYAIHRTGRFVTVRGGKWATAMALARKVSQTLH